MVERATTLRKIRPTEDHDFQTLCTALRARNAEAVRLRIKRRLAHCGVYPIGAG
jgi:hypothetical protein